MVHHKVCPLCLSENITLHLKCTDHFISKEVFQIVKCSVCSFEFTQDYPEEADIGQYYESEDYISHSDTSIGFSNKLYRLARKIMLRRKMRIIRMVTGLKTGSLLDIGSGTGHFANTMRNAGWQVKGIEKNEKARSHSKSNFGLEISAPEYISSLQPGIFDCITLWHVLEHFHEPYKYAAEIIRLLKPGGVCVIALPNSWSFDAVHFGKFWAAYDLPRHLWHFNPATFRRFADKAGFKTEKLLTLPLDIFYISILSEKYSGSRIPLFTGIAVAKMYTFASFFKKTRSSSIIYILRKL
jgi:2-polyprenyl-3-methyl-5-hydroxy-6-metoxy-1,4-benzoquinol methylase